MFFVVVVFCPYLINTQSRIKARANGTAAPSPPQKNKPFDYNALGTFLTNLFINLLYYFTNDLEVLIIII